MPSVTPLHCGTISLDKSVLTAGRGLGERVDAPSVCYLIEAEETVLVDTSFGDVDLMAEWHPGYDCRRERSAPPQAAVRECGHDPEDVDRVFLTHLHWDHCYNLDAFPEAEVLVPRRELEYAVAPYPIHAEGYDATSTGRRPPWLGVDLTPVEGETELCPGVTAVPTPGHTVGHASVAVETDGGTVVAAADAVPTFENLGTDDDPPVQGLAADEFDWWRSARAVEERADRILPGHDWAVLDADAP